MNGVALIEGKELIWLKEQIIALQQQNLAIMKQLQTFLPANTSSSVPDFLSIKEACKKYHLSHVTINNKIKLFETVKGRSIDRLQAGSHKLINEAELQEALRIKSTYTTNFFSKPKD